MYRKGHLLDFYYLSMIGLSVSSYQSSYDYQSSQALWLMI